MGKVRTFAHIPNSVPRVFGGWKYGLEIISEGGMKQRPKHTEIKPGEKSESKIFSWLLREEDSLQLEMRVLDKQ